MTPLLPVIRNNKGSNKINKKKERQMFKTKMFEKKEETR
jgi:hypothetical protein